MEENSNDNSLRTNINVTEPEEQPPSYTPPSPPLGTPFVSKPPKKKRGKLIVLLVLLLLAGGAGAYFFVFQKKDKPAPAAVQPTPPPTPQAEPFAADRQLYFQLGKEVLAYDTENKKQTVLTDAVPNGAEVVDLYADSDTWRLYYVQRGQNAENADLYYVEKGQSSAQKLVSDGSQYLANAEHKLAAYTQFADTTAKRKTSKTYVRQNGKSTLVYESGSTAVNSAGLKDSRYYIVDISLDGKKLLFQRANCHNCDGGISANSFELDIASKKATEVYRSFRTNGSVRYGNKGYVISETNMSSLGEISGPYIETFMTLDKPGGKTVTVMTVNEANWAALGFNLLTNQLNVEKREPNYNKSGATSFDGIYKLTGKTSNDVKALTLKGNPPVKDFRIALGQTAVKGCVSAQLSSRGESQDQTYIVAALCEDGKDTLTYTEVDKLSFKANNQDSSNSLGLKLLN